MKVKRTVYAIVALQQDPVAKSYNKMLCYSPGRDPGWMWVPFDPESLHRMWSYDSVEAAKADIVDRELYFKFGEALTVIPMTLELEFGAIKTHTLRLGPNGLGVGPSISTEVLPEYSTLGKLP